MTQVRAVKPDQQTRANAVNLHGVSKSYGSVRAVRQIDVSVAQGETVAILGPNGAGKSTVINLILGLLPPDDGAITVFGTSPEQALRAGRVGAMPQDGSLIPRVSVSELIQFVRGTYPNPMPLDEILRIARLTELAGRRASKLSGGQAQRVRFALALAGDPDLVILDEPTAAMDVESRRELWSGLRDYTARGNSVIFSTHYLQEADENTDRIVVIAAGTVVADGSAEQIKSLVSGRTVSVEPGDRPLPYFRGLPAVTSAALRGSRIYLRSNDSDATVLGLARDGAIHQLEVTSGGLEEAFLELTQAGHDATEKGENR